MKVCRQQAASCRVAAEDASDACWAEGGAGVPVVATGAEGGGQQDRPELENGRGGRLPFPLLLGAPTVTIYFLFEVFTSSKCGSRFTLVYEVW